MKGGALMGWFEIAIAVAKVIEIIADDKNS